LSVRILVVVVASYLTACIVTTIVATLFSSRPGIVPKALPRPREGSAALDIDKAARLFGSSAKPEPRKDETEDDLRQTDPELAIRRVSAHDYLIDTKTAAWMQPANDCSPRGARLVPWFKNGVSQGFKLISVRQGSLEGQLGFREGNGVRRVNGYAVDSPDRALETYNRLRNERMIDVEIERAGKLVHNTYVIQ
jgi:hypothetical protein